MLTHPQLLSWLKRADFSLGNTSVYFDSNGDPPTGYDIVTWIWRGTGWSSRIVGSFSPDPVTLTIDDDLIEWHDTEDSNPVRPDGVFLILLYFFYFSRLFGLIL